VREVAILVQCGVDPTADEEAEYGRRKEDDEWTQDGEDASEGDEDEGEEPAGVDTNEEEEKEGAWLTDTDEDEEEKDEYLVPAMRGDIATYVRDELLGDNEDTRNTEHPVAHLIDAKSWVGPSECVICLPTLPMLILAPHLFCRTTAGIFHMALILGRDVARRPESV